MYFAEEDGVIKACWTTVATGEVKMPLASFLENSVGEIRAYARGNACSVLPVYEEMKIQETQTGRFTQEDCWTPEKQQRIMAKKLDFPFRYGVTGTQLKAIEDMLQGEDSPSKREEDRRRKLLSDISIE